MHGFTNLGNTCYFNSAIQTFLHIHDISAHILRNKYEGDFRDGKFHGKGTYSYVSGTNKGDKYVGEFKDNKIHGKGTYRYASGDKYIGEFKDNDKNLYNNKLRI